MNLKTALLGAACALLAASCGAGNYKLESGTYAVSGATLASTSDQCGLLPAYQDPAKVIGISVSGTTVTFNLSNDSNAPADSLPTATLTGDTLDQLAEANYTVAFGSTCVVRIHRHVVGDLTANDKADLTLTFDAATESGTCNGQNTSFSAVPCSSAYKFTATKK